MLLLQQKESQYDTPKHAILAWLFFLLVVESFNLQLVLGLLKAVGLSYEHWITEMSEE